MNTSLSFRKESIQQSSTVSAAANRQAVESTRVQDPRHSGDRAISFSLTTLLTL